jgi:hypothetical protein
MMARFSPLFRIPTVVLAICFIAAAGAQEMPSEKACPLTKAEAQGAARAFSAMLPVLQHPRCLNCHGGFADMHENIDTDHPGGMVELPMSLTDRKDRCIGCHDLAKPGEWHLPEPHMFFTRGSIAICRGFQSVGAATGRDLFEHLRTDRLIELGFEGRRADRALTASPPGLARDPFNDLARQWLAVVYGSSTEADWAADFPGEPGSGCGCDPDLFTLLASGVYRSVVTHGELVFESRWTLEVDGESVTGISEWDCCPDPRKDPLINGRIVDGKRLVITRDCRGQGAGECLQVFDGVIGDSGDVTGSWSGSYRHPDESATWTLKLEDPG